MKETYECTFAGCGARVVLDLDHNTQDATYAQGLGPLSDKYRPHDCPVARGLRPAQLARHPNARKVG